MKDRGLRKQRKLCRGQNENMECRYYTPYTLLPGGKKACEWAEVRKRMRKGGGRWVGKGMLKYMKTNQRLPESQSEISVGPKTGRTPVNSLIHWEFLRDSVRYKCVSVCTF